MSKTRSSRSHSTWPAHARNAVTVLVSAVLLAGCGDSPEAMLESAKGYIAKDDLNAAVIQLKNALQEDGSLAEGRYLLGKINLEQGDMLGAVKEFERALQYGYANEKVTPLLARALLGSAEVDRVLKEFGATTLNDTKAQAELLGVLGDAHLAKADVQKARKAFESARRAWACQALFRRRGWRARGG